VLKIEQLLQKEMTRKEFLGTLGLLVISIFGLSTIFGLFTKSSSSIEQTGLIGYGMHDYGP
jgi:hypothetical protein